MSTALRAAVCRKLGLSATATQSEIYRVALSRIAPMGALQDQIKQKMQSIGLPYKEIQVYGSQITVETYGEETANRWATIINQFATVKRVLETTDYAKENRGTRGLPTMVKVYRVYATI